MINREEVEDRAFALAIDAGREWASHVPEIAVTLEKARTGGAAAADTADRATAFRMREAARLTKAMTIGRMPDQWESVGVERVMGDTLDFVSVAPDAVAENAGRPVARLVNSFHDGFQPSGFATGFLVANRLLLTNWHVFRTDDEAEGTGANFLHEFVKFGASIGLRAGPIFKLAPKEFFISDETLDFALVAVKSESIDGKTKLTDLGFTRLIESTPKILKTHPVNIIQHPSGGAKQYAVKKNELVDFDELNLRYQTDTLKGSSGAPAFSVNWELVALHHTAVPWMDAQKRILTADGTVWDDRTMSRERIKWIANQGKRVSRIVQRVRELADSVGERRVWLDTLLATTSDPILSAPGAERADKTLVPVSPTSNAVLAREARTMNTFNISGPTTIYIISDPEKLTTSVPEGIPLVGAEGKTNVFDDDYGRRNGYYSKFLAGFTVPLPTIADGRKNEMLRDNQGKPVILKYHHFSASLNVKRKLPMWVAGNVDYSEERQHGNRDDLGTGPWRHDPRLKAFGAPADLVLDNPQFYAPAQKFDRGHVFRRDDGAWGDSLEEAEFANADTFHWTNCTPQHEAFNQSKRQGIWGEFENHVAAEAKDFGSRLIVFSGPVLSDDDPTNDFGAGVVQYPLEFWKVIVVPSDDGTRLRAFGFTFEQKSTIEEKGLEEFEPGDFDENQASLTYITDLTGVVFGAGLHEADVMKGEVGGPKPLTKSTDIVG